MNTSPFGFRHGRAAASLGPADLINLVRGREVEVSVALTDRDEHLKPVAELAAELGTGPEQVRDIARRLRLPLAGPHPEVEGFEQGAVLRTDETQIRTRIDKER